MNALAIFLFTGVLVGGVRFALLYLAMLGVPVPPELGGALT